MDLNCPREGKNEGQRDADLRADPNLNSNGKMWLLSLFLSGLGEGGGCELEE